MSEAHSHFHRGRRSPERMPFEVLAALEDAVTAHPDQRVMQVIVSALGSDPFYVEDLDAIRALNDYAERRLA